jgi:hypothetical protein
MKLKTLAFAALLGVAAPATVFADDVITTPPLTTTDNQNADANANMAAQTSVGGVADFDTFLKNFSAADFTSAPGKIDIATEFKVVKLSSLANADAAKMKGAAEPHAQDLASLQARIEGNAKAKAALEANGLKSSDVMWIDSTDNVVTIYASDFPAM